MEIKIKEILRGNDQILTMLYLINITDNITNTNSENKARRKLKKCI